MGGGKERESSHRVRRFTKILVTVYTVIILSVITAISAVAITRTDKILSSKVMPLTMGINSQVRMDLESYFSMLEGICDGAVTEKRLLEYSPAKGRNEAIEKEIGLLLSSDAIPDEIIDIGVVYSDNSTAGNISAATLGVFGDKLYDNLLARLGNSRTNNGWFSGYNNDYDRIFHVKQINPDALLFFSFNTSNSSFVNIFTLPEGLEDMTLRLCESNKMIIYSTDPEETAQPVRGAIIAAMDGLKGCYQNKEWLIASDVYGNGWLVICSVPVKTFFKEKNDVSLFILILGICSAVIAVTLCMIITHKMAAPMQSYVSSLDAKARTDAATGLLNRATFEEIANDTLSVGKTDKKYGLILVDVDNFKALTSHLGYTEGDKFLAKAGKWLTENFDDDDCISRFEGGRFVILCAIPEKTRGGAAGYIGAKCSAICKYFTDRTDFGAAASVGAALYPEHSEYYQALAKYVETAMENVRQNGGNGYLLYSKYDKNAPDPDVF